MQYFQKSIVLILENERQEIMKMKSLNYSYRKTLYFLVAFMTVFATAPLMQSCDLDNDGDNYCIYPSSPNAVVTVKTAADNTVYLQLDDSTTLLPLNLKEHPFNGKEVRAFVTIREARDSNPPYTKSVYVSTIDSILTKPSVATLGDKNTEVYGNDPVEIYKDFPTVCEDNYLTLAIGTVWGQPAKAHLVNLVTGVNPDDPYEVELRQNAYGDTKGKMGYTTVAFSLKALPKTGGKKVKLKVRFNSFEGEKTAEFDYQTKD